MTEVTVIDRNTFLIAFAVVWGALALYLVYLHLLQARLAREVARLTRQDRPGDSLRPPPGP